MPISEASAARRFAVAAALIAALAAGCATTSAPRDAGRARAVLSERPYLQSPLTGYPLVLAPARQEAVLDAWASLVERLDPDAAGRQAAALVAVTPGLHPAAVVLAQAEVVRGEADAARARLEPILAELPEYDAARLLLARARDLLGEVPEAYREYRALAPRISAARDRAAELETRAVEIVGRRVDDALSRGHVEAGRADLALLREWAPEARATLEAERRVAAAEGDGLAELSAVRRLRALAPEERGLRLREADLELEVGDVGRGLELLEELAAASPDDPELTERLGRARFRWRLELLPPSSRELTRRPELTRGDFAVLLYWLFPSVRYGRVVGGGTIANDVFDHPAREQIVKVVNLGLMQVDRTLHRFRPESPLSQGEALRSLLSLLLLQQPRLACAEGATAGELERSTTALCRVSAACGLLPGEGDCLPGATVSGPEAVEAARRTLEQLGAD